MDGADVNGGNAEVAREDPNLEMVGASDSQEEPSETSADVKMDDQEINGDLKGPLKRAGTPASRRKLRKFKANSTSTIESGTKPKARERKRKLSERDEMSSEDSTEFNGFDSQGTDHAESGSHVLKKLIAEAESAESLQFDDSVDLFDIRRIKKEKESDKSETDSIGVPNSLESETERQRTEESSANSSPSVTSQKSKASRISRGASPGSAVKQKVPIDMTNPAFKEPFKYGWKRELVYRAGSENSIKRMADIYYYTPKGKKVRSFREVAEFLHTKELTIDNFTFCKEPLGLDDPEKEVIRDAKRARDSGSYSATPPKKVLKKATPVKKVVEKPPTPSPPRPVGRPPKGGGTPGFRVKLPGKRGPQKKTKSPPDESEMLPPQWSSPAPGRRSQPPPVEKSPPAKPKRALKTKVQEPCSIRCSTSMGLIPSLQCCVCLCLYHPECVEGRHFAGSEDYVCKNCQPDSGESYQQQHQPMTPSLTPPPLIPISMLGAQAAKPKHPISMTPPKLQRIPKPDGAESQTKNSSKPTKTAAALPKAATTPDKEESWYTQARNELMPGLDGTLPKPAQNIALMAGKKYIVVPKNNAMAVQPAITVKPDKIGDKPPMLHDSAMTDAFGTNVEKQSTIPRSPINELINDAKMKLDESIQSEKKEMNSGTTDAASNSAPNVSTSVVVSNIASDVPLNLASNVVSNIVSSVASNATSNVASNITSNVASNVTAEETNELSDGGARVEQPETVRVTNDCSEALSAPENEPKEIDATQETTSECAPTTSNSLVPSNEESLLPADVALAKDKIETLATKADTSSVDCKRRQFQAETDQRQHFMVSVCAGYHALSRIFQYLKVQELLRAARVCRMWRDLAVHPSLWKTVRMKNSQVTDWDGLAEALKRRGTQHLDLRKMLVVPEFEGIWKKFVSVIPRVTSLVKLELCRCPVVVVEEVIKNCPQLEVLSAMSIKCDSLNLESVGNLKRCQELKLKAINGMSLEGDLSPLQTLIQLTHLSLTSVKELGKRRIDILESLTNLETLELGECSDFPEEFGTRVLLRLHNLKRLRLEKGQGSCCTFDILEGVSKLENLSQLELVNFDVKNGFDKCLANCKNIKRLLMIPTYISQSATSNNMVLGGVTELSNNLTHFVWGVTLELLRVTELFVDQCNQMNKQVTGDSIPVLKPVPCLKLIEDVEEEDSLKGDDKVLPNQTNPQVDILPLPQLQKLLLTALPKTRVKILKIPFHATWRQSISDSTAQ